ncbi:MAG: DUF47 family protein [Magnetococcales bacterium]|nr:DUF47 family protein [Magnetococcales bacterium]NGZ06698.1 DUF47 family protein [Magnetococcales bacterium]
MTLTQKLINNVFPKVPDFYGMIQEHCGVCVESLEALVAFMETNDPAKGNLVRELEKKGDEIKARNMAVLGQAFATPLDREDIYRAITTIDQIINYAKTTVREMEVLALTPDQYTLEIAVLIKDGVVALSTGFKNLEVNPQQVAEDAAAVIKAERNTEKAYRRAISSLFQADAQMMQELDSNTPGADSKALLQVMDMFKRREIYRHMSNCADHLARAGNVLHDIVVQAV